VTEIVRPTISALPGSDPSTIGTGLLAMAADLMPSLVGEGPMLSSDIHASLFTVARFLPHGDDCASAHCLADHAEQMLAAHLVASGEVAPGASTSQTLRSWAAGASMPAVIARLRAAAEQYRREEAGEVAPPPPTEDGMRVALGGRPTALAGGADATC
jgi:hypothetical protein